MKRLAIDWGDLTLAFDSSFVPEDVMERVIRPLQQDS